MLPLLLALGGCVSPQWRSAARQCGKVLEFAAPVLDRCAKHMAIYHGGAKLTEDGGITAPEGLRGRE